MIEIYTEEGVIALDNETFPLTLAESYRVTMQRAADYYSGSRGVAQLRPSSRMLFIKANSSASVGIGKAPGHSGGSLVSKSYGFTVNIYEFDQGVVQESGVFGAEIFNSNNVKIFSAVDYQLGFKNVADITNPTSIGAGDVAFCYPLAVEAYNFMEHIWVRGRPGGRTQGGIFTPRFMRAWGDVNDQYIYSQEDLAFENSESFWGNAILLDCSQLPVPYARPS